MKRAAYILLALFVIAVPALVASAVLWHFNRATFLDILPVQSDEIMYWHQAYTFGEVGLNGGYYTAGELLPRLGRFYAWGAATPVYYGTLGAVLGWPLWGIAVANLALYSMAVGVFIWLARLSWEQLFWLGGLLATFHPFLLYSPTQYIEVPNMAAGLLFAGLFARLFAAVREGRPAGRALWLSTAIAIFLVAVTRFPWTFLYAPLLLLTVRPKSLRGWLVTLVQSGVLMLLPILPYALTSAPYPETILSRLSRNATLTRALRIVGNNIERNFRGFTDGDHLERHVLIGAVAIAVALTLALAAYLFWRSRGRHVSDRLRRAVPEAALAWFMLSLLLMFMMIVYDVHGLRGYRMLAGTLLMLIGLTIAFRRRWLLVPLLLYQTVAFPYALYFYDNFTNFQTSPEKLARYEEYRPQLARVLTYDTDAPSPWCNTVLYDLFYLLGETSILVATPPGLGLSITEAVPDGKMPPSPRSAYIALRDGNYAEYREGLNLEPLLPLPDGMLYRNLNSGCE